MPALNGELVKVMRAALEEIMRKVPQERASSAIKAHLAESILKAAARGYTTHDSFIAAAQNELPSILSLFNVTERLP